MTAANFSPQDQEFLRKFYASAWINIQAEAKVNSHNINNPALAKEIFERRFPGVEIPNGQPQEDQLKIVVESFDKITAKMIDWLVAGYLARKMYHYMFAPKGRGKTVSFANFFTVCLTTGKWPEGWPGPRETKPVNVGRINIEDPAAELLVPNLAWAGADLSRVFLLNEVEIGGQKRILDLSDHSHRAALEELIVKLEISVLFVEPLSNHKGKSRGNSDDDMRPIHTELALMAARTGCSIIGIGHTNRRNDGDVIEKAKGSGASTEVARRNFYMDFNRDNKDERILSDAASNIPVGPSLVFGVEEAPDGWEYKGKDEKVVKFEGDYRRPRRAILKRTQEGDANDTLDASREKKNDADLKREWLREQLEGKGSVPASEIKQALTNSGHKWSFASIGTTATRIGVKKDGRGKDAKWALHEEGGLPF
jgi:hypothetical protein